MPLNLIGASATDQSVVGFIASEIRGFLFVGSGVYSWPLWYLLASVVGFALVYFMLRKGLKPSLILVVSAIAMLTGFAISCLHEWEDAPRAIASMVDAYYLVFTNVRNGVFEGFSTLPSGLFGHALEHRCRLAPSHIRRSCFHRGAWVHRRVLRCTPSVLRRFRDGSIHPFRA